MYRSGIKGMEWGNRESVTASQRAGRDRWNVMISDDGLDHRKLPEEDCRGEGVRASSKVTSSSGLKAALLTL